MTQYCSSQIKQTASTKGNVREKLEEKSLSELWLVVREEFAMDEESVGELHRRAAQHLVVCGPALPQRPLLLSGHLGGEGRQVKLLGLHRDELLHEVVDGGDQHAGLLL